MHGGPRLNLFGRQLLVRRVTAGWSVAVASEALGASRATGHKWVRRHREEGDAGLEDRPCRRQGCPQQLSAEQ